MIIVGLNAFHGDAAACLVRDGILVAAAEEERFRRIKHWAGFPSQAMLYCLKEAGIRLADVDHIAVNSDPRANRFQRLAYVALHRPDLRLVLDRLKNHRKRSSLDHELAVAFPNERFKGRIHRVEHHLAHLASAFLPSPFEEAAIVSIDGFGDFSSAAWGVGRHNDMTIDRRVLFPHSLGVFYQALTQYLGFPHYGDEYKVMGLAPYGKPTFLEAMRRIVRLEADGGFALDLTYFRHHRENISYQWNGGSPCVGTLYSAALENLLGRPRASNQPLTARHHDIASSAQAMYEEAFFNVLNCVWNKHRLPRVAISGGCAMNSVANGRIRHATPIRQVYVQAAAGDAGGAIGAALTLWHRHGGTRNFVMNDAYWGPRADLCEIDHLLNSNAESLKRLHCTVRRFADNADLYRTTAAAIARGEVIGWFAGRMEWGPRALGNRSIICDPRRHDAKQILNAKIKRRESFRPFAPSVLAEEASAWFEDDDDVPFMTQVVQVKPTKRPLIPAVTHVDGSGRLQTVRQEANPHYHALISAFFQLTGVPMVLNTSFNENEPIVCTPREALDCFLRTNMDVLVLETMMIEREGSENERSLELDEVQQ